MPSIDADSSGKDTPIVPAAGCPSDSLKVPVIDVQQCLSASSSGLPSPCTMNQIEIASREWGFFQLVNHGVDMGIVQRAMEASRAFFALPLEAKVACPRTPDNAWGYFNNELTKQKVDLKEGFDYGYLADPNAPDDHPTNASAIDGVNRWPQGQEEIVAALKAHYVEMHRAALALLPLYAEALGLRRGELAAYFKPSHSSFARLNYYPPSNASVRRGQDFGVNEHTDAGLLTLLVADDVPGLQVLHKGAWHTIPPLEGAITVNVGDMFQVLTNDRFIAPLHRVLPSGSRPRFSIPYFLNPCYDAVIAPHAQILKEYNEEPRYRGISWREFRLRRFEGDVADKGREVQISDYRIDKT